MAAHFGPSTAIAEHFNYDSLLHKEISMPIPVWILLGFAAWTLLILFATVGVYRWSRILTGRTAIATWRADEQQGSEWYRRAMRAHMNCLENLPIYTAIVVALLAARVTSPIVDGLAITILVARICQSSIHLLLEQTNMVASIRFAFYFVQAISMIAMGILIAISAHG
jgi:uncharacterized MAPEG superfamily protein